MTAHAHSHDGHESCNGHDHSHAPKVTERNRRRVGWAAVLTGLFMIVEVAGGLISGSLALLADAGHMLTDFAALAMAWAAFQIAQRPANSRFTYGYDRLPVLVAFLNGFTLILLSLWIVWEAVQRFIAPGEVLAGPMLYVAIAGLMVNLIVFKILMGADRHNLNVRGAMLHVLGDLLGSVAAIAAALIILTTGWVAADPILSIFVALLIARSAWGLVKTSAQVLMQGAPDGATTETIETELLTEIPNLKSISDLRLWSLSNDDRILTLKAEINDGSSASETLRAMRKTLHDKFHIEDATIEITHSDQKAP